MSADKLKNNSGLQPSLASGNCQNKICIRVPGSSGNLGPGFDTLALALSVYAKLTFTILADDDENIPFVTAAGFDQKSLDTAIPRFMMRVLTERIEMDPHLLKRLRVNIESEIPIGRGFGSSAALVLAALWASDRIANRTPETRSLLYRATMIEGHPDNVAASLLGGLAVACVSDDRKTVLTHKLNWPEEWRLILVVPPYQLATAKARNAVPKSVPHRDAVYNVQRTALLLSAIQEKDEELLKEALYDRLHEKYRAELVPELANLKKELRDGPAIGCVLSGAGSSVLVLVNEGKKKELLEQIGSWQKQQSQESHILDLKADKAGLEELDV